MVPETFYEALFEDSNNFLGQQRLGNQVSVMLGYFNVKLTD